MASLQCIVVTPERTVLEAEADFIALPLYDGEIGIAPGRGPLIGRLGYGEMRLRTGSQTKRFYVDGGFVQVAKDVISVLTSRALPASDVNATTAREQITAALKKPIGTPELEQIRDRLLSQARAQVRVAERGDK